ncbi:MAG TPA: hypothetical protein VNH44_07750 [Micropepsaceae bacterium]|nr:hypothetical protein [Micropepsaceae bacterium]
MAQYFYLSLNQTGDVCGSEVMEVENDQDAINWAHRICNHGIGKGFEVWRNGQLIHAFPGVAASRKARV